MTTFSTVLEYSSSAGLVLLLLSFGLQNSRRGWKRPEHDVMSLSVAQLLESAVKSAKGYLRVVPKRPIHGSEPMRRAAWNYQNVSGAHYPFLAALNGFSANLAATGIFDADRRAASNNGRPSAQHVDDIGIEIMNLDLTGTCATAGVNLVGAVVEQHGAFFKCLVYALAFDERDWLGGKSLGCREA
jgi:hypothetical protein